MAMNNYILQKIIYAYQNGGDDLYMPTYIDADGFGKVVSRDKSIKNLKIFSKAIQQSAKFFVDMSGEKLRSEEVLTCLSDMKVYLPYPCTFIQFKYEDIYLNTLFTETVTDKGIDWYDIEPSDFMVEIVLSDYSGNQMTYDRCSYHHRNLNLSGDGSVSAETNILGLGSNFRTNDHMPKTFSESVIRTYLQFLVMLNYPEIVVADEVLGRPNNVVGHVPVKDMRRNTLMKKPKYQHKTLVLDMYGDKSGGESSSGGRSKGTAFHSVRKHLRQYQNGKKVFVKAHFRGSKEVGTIFKDYKIDA
tara:strand:+ start:333 stop:1238 length:906 start_codon:yes stop_codon:yes gene_type:complete